MKTQGRMCSLEVILATLCLFAFSALAEDVIAQEVAAQDAATLVPAGKITGLEAKLIGTKRAKSPARKKLAFRRVIREGDALLERYQAAPNRYKILGLLFRARQELISLDDTATNRRAFLETCRQLATAPDEYAAIRLDADLLLSQTDAARKGADLQARGDALRSLVTRYQDTEVEAKVIRIAMLMALEFGDTRLVGHLRERIALRFAGDLDMISFQRDKLAGQVFGAPFIGAFQQVDGKLVRFPMDYLGMTTAIYFWSKENDGEADLKQLAAAWKKAEVEAKATGRFRFVSVNLDKLPDAGEGILRGLGLDWPALRLPGGQDSPIYRAYVRRAPATIVTVSPTGYAALYMAGPRSNRTYERRLQSMLARTWARARYASQLQSIFAGEFLIMETEGGFDPSSPPEWKAIASAEPGNDTLARTAASVPADELHAIQACFIRPPLRYRVSRDEVLANYEKADALCRAAIAAHPEAPDLWIVRNRRIIALMGLWRVRGDHDQFAAAVTEAKAALDQGYPPGTDTTARFCIARDSFRAADADPEAIIENFLDASGEKQGGAAALALAAILSLDAGDRKLHEQYRRAFLDKHGNSPTMWTASSFLLDRYHRYWQYHPPFVAGWTYGRRQGHFLAIGHPEDAQRTLRAEFKTLDGGTVRVPEDSKGKWTVISFAQDAGGNAFSRGIAAFIAERPFEDVNLFAAVMNEDADAARAALKEKKKPDDFPTLLVPGGIQNPIVRKLGILAEDTRPNLVILRPDGSIAGALSGLTMSAQHGNVIQNILEWHDEKAVDEALARGDLDEAKRLAFAFAPVEEPASTKKKKKKKISVPHLRSRAKVYMTMKNWKAALADVEQAYLAVNSKAGWLSMRTDDLDETEELRAAIRRAYEQAKSAK